MSTVNATPNDYYVSHGWLYKLSEISKDLQTWWLLLIGSGFVVTVLLVFASHQRVPHVEEFTLISAAGIFLASIILSTLSTERKAQKDDDCPFIWMARIRCTMAVGIAAVAGFAAAHTGNGNPAAIASVGVLSARAAWVAGMLLGFIFGLPHAPPKIETPTQAADRAENDQANADAHPPTNLDQIAVG